jgi:hypothetical protein
MLIRREDFGDINELKPNSKKKIWFTCDNCGVGILQIYKNYLNQKDGKFCRSCRNKHTAKREDVKEKQSKATKEMWKNKEFKKKMSKKLSKSCKEAWSSKKKKEVSLKNNYKKKPKGENYRHIRNIKEIENFLIKNNIPYIKDNKIFYLNDGKLELRYVDSENHKMDYEKRFGIKGISHDYFINITKSNKEKNIRTIWIKDWEVEESKTIKNIDGEELKNYRRKWNVLQSYIKTATGNIENRFYARDCEVRKIDNKLLRPFLEENCFYGYRSANTNLGLFLKKDKNGFKKDTLLMVYTFGHPFFSRGLYDIEVIRVGTKLFCQVIGGASKLLKYFLVNYPTIQVGKNKKIVEVNKIVFIVDADHNDGRSLETLGFKFVSHKGHGFMNVDSTTGEVFQRKPMQHKLIMEKMKKGEVYSVSNAGSIIYMLERDEYLKKFKK